MSVATDAVRDTVATVRLVASSPGLRTVNLAAAGSLVGDFAYATAVVVYVYGWAGPTGVGVYITIRMAVVAVLLPFLASLADRLPRVPFLVGTDLVRAVLVTLAAGLVWLQVPPPVVLAVALLASLVGAPFRPAVAALVPTLARTPEELTGSNAVTGTLEAVAVFAGPAVAGLLLGAAGVPVVFLVQAASFVWSAVVLARLRRTAAPQPPPSSASAAEPEDAEGSVEAVAEPPHGVLAGFGVIGRSAPLRLAVVLVVLQCVVAGAAGVFTVTIALDVVRLGNPGLGYLEAVSGIGAVVGGVVALARASRSSVARDLGLGVAGWAVPLLLVAVWPHPVAAFVALAAIGLANPLVDVNAATLLQRLTPEGLVGRVFGALESAVLGAMALGGLLMPLLLRAFGLRWGLVVLAVPVAVVVAVAYGRLARLDRTTEPPAHLEFLRALPLFRAVPPVALESLADRLEAVHVPAGTTVVREGEPGDRFYLVEDGLLEARRGDTVLRTMAAGDQFGEIALLRDVPRTATVVARTDTDLLALDRATFLGAVTAHEDYARQVESVAAFRVRH